MKKSQDGKTVRQNDTYTATRKHQVNLQRNQTLYFQVGLILALLACIGLMELRSSPTSNQDSIAQLDDEEIVFIPTVDIQKKLPKQQKVVKQVAQQQDPADFEVVPDDTEILKDILPPTSETDFDKKIVEPGDVPFEEEPVDIVDVPFINIEEVPIFPGCEGLATNAERKDCMSSKVAKFVNRKFKTGVGEDLGLSGLNRIFVTFKIDQNGNVIDVLSKSTHPKLEKEAIRVVNLLPKMTPGKQRGVPVRVLYSLPISFQIQD